MPGTKVPRTFGQGTPRRRAALLAALALSAVLIAGCGKASPASSTASEATGPLPSKVLAAKGDAICERLREALNAADREAGGTTLPGRAKLSVLFAAAEERASNQLARLKPEEASAELEWQQAIAKRRALIAYHHRMTKYASHGEKGPLEATYKAYKVAQWQMQLGFKHSRFGFKICWDIG